MKKSKHILKTYFETGDKPTQKHYEDLIDSLQHVDDAISDTNLPENIALKNENNNFSSEQTFQENVTAPNFLGNSIGDKATVATPGGPYTIRNNSGQTIARFADSFDINFYGNISLPTDKYFFFGSSNNGRFFANANDTYFDALNGDFLLRNLHNGSKIYLKTKASNGIDQDLLIADGDLGNISLRYQNTEVLKTSSDGVDLSENLAIPTDKYLHLGDNKDLRLWHASTGHSLVDNYQGHLYFRNRSNGSGIYFQLEDNDGNNQALLQLDGAAGQVYMRYQNELRMSVISTGVNVQGILEADNDDEDFALRVVSSNRYTGISFQDGSQTRNLLYDGTDNEFFIQNAGLKVSNNLEIQGTSSFVNAATFDSSATASTFLVDAPSGWLVKNTVGNHGVYFDGDETIIQSKGVFSVRADGTSVNLRNTFVNGTLEVDNKLDANGEVSLGWNNSLTLGEDPYKFSISRTTVGLLHTSFRDDYDNPGARVEFVMRHGSANENVPLYMLGNGESHFNGLVYANAGIDVSSDGTDGDEVLRLSLDGGRDWTFKQKGTGSATSLELRSTQHKDFYLSSTASFFRSSLDDANHLILNHQNKTAVLQGTLDVNGVTTVEELILDPSSSLAQIKVGSSRPLEFNPTSEVLYLADGETQIYVNSGDIETGGHIKPAGGYRSSDGTAGFNGTFTAGAYSITVKDGLITDAVNIS